MHFRETINVINLLNLGYEWSILRSMHVFHMLKRFESKLWALLWHYLRIYCRLSHMVKRLSC